MSSVQVQGSTAAMIYLMLLLCAVNAATNNQGKKIRLEDIENDNLISERSSAGKSAQSNSFYTTPKPPPELHYGFTPLKQYFTPPTEAPHHSQTQLENAYNGGIGHQQSNEFQQYQLQQPQQNYYQQPQQQYYQYQTLPAGIDTGSEGEDYSRLQPPASDYQNNNQHFQREINYQTSNSPQYNSLPQEYQQPADSAVPPPNVPFPEKLPQFQPPPQQSLRTNQQYRIPQQERYEQQHPALTQQYQNFQLEQHNQNIPSQQFQNIQSQQFQDIQSQHLQNVQPQDPQNVQSQQYQNGQIRQNSNIQLQQNIEQLKPLRSNTPSGKSLPFPEFPDINFPKDSLSFKQFQSGVSQDINSLQYLQSPLQNFGGLSYFGNDAFSSDYLGTFNNVFNHNLLLPAASTRINSYAQPEGSLQYLTLIPPNFVDNGPQRGFDRAVPKKPRTKLLSQGTHSDRKYQKYTQTRYSAKDLQKPETPAGHVTYQIVPKKKPTSLLDSYVPSILQVQFYKEQQLKLQQQQQQQQEGVNELNDDLQPPPQQSQQPVNPKKSNSQKRSSFGIRPNYSRV